MKYISTDNTNGRVGFKEAVLKGLAPGGGLYVPEMLPHVEATFFDKMDSLSIRDLAYPLLHPFVSDDLSDAQLSAVIDHTFQFDIPVKQISETGIYVLELFHGPTWAFKDVGVRFLAGCLSQWTDQAKETIILVATSGDTGGAVANGFYNQPGIKVVILYPKGKISPLQEMQIAGMGGNIIALAVDGSFDDCQHMVKKAFNDKTLRSKINITSANSINIARWLPQMIFYAIAWREIRKQGIESRLSIPSGNYGNIAAAFLMHDIGLTFKEILAAHNANDTIPRFLSSGNYAPGKTVSTLANAMDVNDPSNFVRLRYLQQHQYRNRLVDFRAQSVSDTQILEAIRDAWHNHHYLLDPHTATAWHMLKENGGKGIIVATAHPYKFEDVIIKALGFYPQEWIKTWESGPIKSISVPADYFAIREFLTLHAS
ncbi:MAG: threonine synthase [Saprospiraceae bacterium]|nr:threonine synthase [Candidatus Opimibacter skivensis]